LVVSGDKRLAGIITDGDLRRALLEQKIIHDLDVQDLMSPSPKTVDENQTAAEALGIMEYNAITLLVIVDKQNQVRGIVHLHDLLGREEFRVDEGDNRTSRTHR
jgi:arabinose-5-phosphate isomerase